MPTVATVLVTRDRRDLLRESLAAVLTQTRPPERVVVVDNASGDGTAEMIAEEFPAVELVRLERNQGATGGFYEGIRAGCERGADWLWLLDDDAVAAPTALAELISALERVPPGPAPALMAGRVEWRDGQPHPMNVPTVRRRDRTALVDGVRRRLLPLRATTWVSLLLACDAVRAEGMPDRRFFYQADDIEYTARMLRRRRGFLVPASVVEHRTQTRQTWLNDDQRFFNHVRNTLFMLRGRAWGAREKPALAWWLLVSAARFLRGDGRRSRLAVLARALFAGLR